MDAVQARDVAVENLQDQYTVFVKNELPVTATIAIRGCTNQPIPVQLLVEKPGGEVGTVGPVNVVAREDEEQVAVELRYVPEQPGNYKLTRAGRRAAGRVGDEEQPVERLPPRAGGRPEDPVPGRRAARRAAVPAAGPGSFSRHGIGVPVDRSTAAGQVARRCRQPAARPEVRCVHPGRLGRRGAGQGAICSCWPRRSAAARGWRCWAAITASAPAAIATRRWRT